MQLDPSTAPKRVEFTLEQCCDLVTKTQVAVLEHLAATAVRQKAEARYSKKRWQRGWTYMRPTQHVKAQTLNALKRLGLIESCCHELHGADLIRISRKGVEVLEHFKGGVIYA